MPQNLLDTDSFNGTNGNNLSTYSVNWPVFGNWNECQIRGTPGMGGNVGGMGNRRTGQTWTDDHWAEVTLDGTNVVDTHYFVGVRATDDSPAGHGYGGGASVTDDASVYAIYRFDPGGTKTRLLLDPGSNTITAGDVINVQAVGTTITLTVTRSASQLLSISTTDATYSTGGTPLLFVNNSGVTRLAGSWRAGSVTAVVAGAIGAPTPPVTFVRLRQY